ncbi:hypothetical protein [Luteibacter yeojuensis]|uniref:Uncharacterized protein n=1 Tax=Luteibacter yeojuensis TaxID=345309 RepID=A0A0F3KZ14_9GAMM|nr:hypothetical protein [Luteibacter yeojuensis]KJV36401.1 hypothetical protein VI08_04565 [Luteibacter yeojuensis]
MVSAAFVLLAFAAVLNHVLSMMFTERLVRSLGGTPDEDRPYHRYATRALVGAHPVPAGYLNVLCWFLRITTELLFVAFCGLLYVTFSGVQDDSTCAACLLDPTAKTPHFWLGYLGVVSVLAGVNVAGMMVYRADVDKREESGAPLDVRKLRMALRMIFVDEAAPIDRMARIFRGITRWALLVGILCLVGWAALGWHDAL